MADVRAVLDDLPTARDAVDNGLALWMFDEEGAVQRIQHALKYGNRPRYGHALGALLGEAYRRAVQAVPDVVVPVPLYRTRRYERGYNQSTTLAHGVGEELGIAVDETLVRRTRPTRSQAHLSRTERWSNVVGAFTVATGADPEDTRVLIVDDVMTTGSTLSAVAVSLKERGVRAVDVATLALARD